MESHKSCFYKCPRCMYATNKKTHMKNHMHRKNPCKIHIDGIFLTEKIKSDVLNCDYKHIKHDSQIPPQHSNTTNNTYNLTHTIIHQQCNILTHQDLVSMVLPHIKSLKCGQSNVNHKDFFTKDDDHPGTIELNTSSDKTSADAKDFLDKIKHIIQTNAETTYDMIEKLVCNIGPIVMPP